MAYSSTNLEVMIASPSDVGEEREVCRGVIQEWNYNYSRRDGITLMATGWDTHSAPELGNRPQNIINEKILDKADILIGIFWTRIGTPTGEAESGTVEEIKRHISYEKPALLYFSNKPVVPDSIDNEQYLKLSEFKSWASEQGLIDFFESPEEFRSKLQKHLPRILMENEYLNKLTEKLPSDYNFTIKETGRSSPKGISQNLSEEEVQMLKGAANSDGYVYSLMFIGGRSIKAGDKEYVGSKASPRECAKWEAALNGLSGKGLIKDQSYKGEVFQVTHLGYEVADCLN